MAGILCMMWFVHREGDATILHQHITVRHLLLLNMGPINVHTTQLIMSNCHHIPQTLLSNSLKYVLLILHDNYNFDYVFF